MSSALLRGDQRRARAAEDVEDPLPSAGTALAFVLKRGVVARGGRRNYAASGGVYLDVMTEYWALTED